jgi:DNA-binding NarL/FixJ family response regulator
MRLRIRILLADDHAVFRSGLKSLLEKEKDFEVVGETGTGYDTVKAAQKDNVDLLLLDISMPGLSGSDVAKSILQKRPELPIVVLTMHEDEYYLREFFQIGVRSFVLKKSTGDEVLRAIRAAFNGEYFIDPALAKYVIDPLYGNKKRSPADNPLDTLTKREQDVLRLLAFGHTNAEISRKLEISQRTVESHRSSIMEKLEFNTRAELVRFAIDHKLMKLD